jgi:large subunit ribosomal protein L29
MNFKELKKKTESDLHKILSESRERLRELRFKDANKQLKNIREIRTLRITVAQVLTLLNFKKTDKTSKKEIKIESEDKQNDKK